MASQKPGEARRGLLSLIKVSPLLPEVELCNLSLSSPSCQASEALEWTQRRPV